MRDTISQIQNKNYKFNFSKINFLCYNPHCSENNTLGSEDKVIKDASLASKKLEVHLQLIVLLENLKKTLFLSMYHDQALIPFKILNKNGINITIGLNYRRLSPAHGTANNIKFKNTADINSYLACMKL